MHVAIAQDGFINCQLFPAQRQDCKTIEELWLSWPWNKIKYVVADKGYDSGQLRDFIKINKATPVIPFKGIDALPESLTAKVFYNTELYAKCHIIDRLLGRMKENKRIAMWFDKLDITFLSFSDYQII
jgi:transposase